MKQRLKELGFRLPIVVGLTAFVLVRALSNVLRRS
jgi:hypothetical protein